MASPPDPPDDRTDDELLGAARRGDDAAFARLLEHHDPLLRRMVGALVDHRDTERVLSEGYVKAYRAVGRAAGAALPWLGRACYLTALDEVRRRERRRTGGPGRKPVGEPSPGPGGRLPPDQRAVLVLDEDLSRDAIAEVLGTSPVTVERLRARIDPDAAAALDVAEPPASDQFWKALGARLLAERAAPPAPPPRIERAAAPPEPTQAKSPPLAMQRRPPSATRRTAGPDPVEGLAIGARRRRPRRRIDPRVVLGAVVVLAIAVALVVVIRLASEAASPVRENSVAEISGKVADALDASSFSASYERTTAGADGPERVSYDVVRNDSGSYRLSREDGLRQVAYDVPSATRWERAVALDGSVLLTQDTGVAAGPPDPSGAEAALPDTELGTALRALSTVTDREAEATRVEGRDAWRMEGPLEHTGDGPSRVELVVDRVQLAPMSVELTDGDRVIRSVHFDEVTFEVLAPGPFTVDASGVEPQTTDHGFRAVSLREAMAAVGARPVRPTYLPTGFELVDTALHEADGIVSLRYQRGVQQVVVTTRPASAATSGDPFERTDPVESDAVEVERGPFRDVEARRTMTVTPPPALWGQSAAVAFTVSGDLTADELLRVAESMR